MASYHDYLNISCSENLKQMKVIIIHLSADGAKGGDLIASFGPEVGLLNYLAVPEVGIFEVLQTFEYRSFPWVGNFRYI